MLQDIILYSKNSGQDAKLIITSNSLYIVQNLSTKKYCKANSIDCVVLTPFCNELVVFYDPKGDRVTT